MGSQPYGCLYCATAASFRGDKARMPKTCPTRTHLEVVHDPAPYLEPERHAMMVAADATPFDENHVLRTRVEELVAFARERGIRKIGVAFCVSLIKEAQQLGKMLKREGLEAELVCCRVGAIDYSEIGLPKAHPERFAAICNPVAQAKMLDAAKVDLVAQVGLCIGHDLILQKECEAPVTTLVVKDRALDHHPVRALRPEPKAEVRRIDVDALAASLRSNRPPLVVDVRTPDEFFDEGRIPGALLVPLEHLAAELPALREIATPIVVACRTTPRAVLGAGVLTRAGMSDVAALVGGVVAWKERGHPIEIDARS